MIHSKHSKCTIQINREWCLCLNNRLLVFCIGNYFAFYLIKLKKKIDIHLIMSYNENLM